MRHTARIPLGIRSLLAMIAALGLAAGALAAGAAGSASASPLASGPAWTGTFDDFHTSGWDTGWGLTSDTAQCAIAVGTYACNWGYGNLAPVADPTAPGGGYALKVTYPALSGPPSCTVSSTGCVLGGGQFYQDLTTNGQTALHNSSTIDLKYYYNFPVGFDFGGKTAGKLPGLYGGVPGCESGGQRCSDGWSTRYMWRGGSATDPKGELYFYGGTGDGYGADVCLGDWTFPADGQWHSIEQLVDIATSEISIWSDGKLVCQTDPAGAGVQAFASPVSGVFFSTFHGGHDTSWSPTKTTSDEFADFTLSTAAQGGTTPPTSGAPTTAPASSAPPTTTPPTTAPPTTTPPTAPPTAPAPGLSATVTETKGWSDGYEDSVTVTNNSGAAILNWKVQLTLPPNLTVTSAWRAAQTSSGQVQTFTNLSYDGTIANGASVTFGFSGALSSTYAPPTNVTVT